MCAPAGDRCEEGDGVHEGEPLDEEDADADPAEGDEEGSGAQGGDRGGKGDAALIPHCR